MSKLKAPSSGVTIRMYRHGLGDCFLLAFPTDVPGEAYYVLIDCGVILGTKDADATMSRVAQDVEAATGGDVHLLVVTHEHWDHVSGFLQAGEVFGRLRIHNVWLAWTEDPADELARRLRARFEADLQALRVAVSRSSSAEAIAPIASLLDFFGDATPESGAGSALAARRGDNTRAALQAVRDFARQSNAEPEYRRPGDGPISLPGIQGIGSTPGVRLYVLGPPHDERLLRRVNPTVSGNEVYTEGAGIAPRAAFLLAMSEPSALSAADQELREKCLPFDQRLRIPPEEAANRQFFQVHYGLKAPRSDGTPLEGSAGLSSGPTEIAWRSLDDVWPTSATAEELALQLDSYTNNTSLVLAIELVSTGKVLLFVGDAQVGNWISWKDLSWSVADGAGPARKVLASDLLARTVFYKVGHHGSHNATVRGIGAEKWGLELMTSSDLVAMIPVDHAMALVKRWGKIPFEPLVARLEELADHRVVRSDDPIPKQKPSTMDEASWQEFRASLEESDLYFQLTVKG